MIATETAPADLSLLDLYRQLADSPMGTVRHGELFNEWQRRVNLSRDAQPGRTHHRWTPEQFDAFTDMVLSGVGTHDVVADHLILFGANPEMVRALADAARPYC